MTGKRVAIVVAHPDDETLGFGGAMARHADAGDAVSTFIMATGLTSRGPGAAEEALDALRDDARAACRILGCDDVAFGGMPDNSMDAVALLDVVKAVEAFLGPRAPQIVYTHAPDDLNVDHEIVARAVLTACRPLPGASVETLLAGEVFSSSEYGAPEKRFQPDTYVALSEDHLRRKIAALEAYRAELRAYPHPRSSRTVEAAARLRGSECGVEAAEAFRLLKQVTRL